MKKFVPVSGQDADGKVVPAGARILTNIGLRRLAKTTA
jgi:hypothetical protein